MLTKHVLYQLSYISIERCRVSGGLPSTRYIIADSNLFVKGFLKKSFIFFA